MKRLLIFLMIAIGLSACAPSEPALAHKFIQAAEQGNGPAMRALVSSSCILDWSSELCFTSSGDAKWAKFVKENPVTFTYLYSEERPTAYGSFTYIMYAVDISAAVTNNGAVVKDRNGNIQRKKVQWYLTIVIDTSSNDVEKGKIVATIVS